MSLSNYLKMFHNDIDDIDVVIEANYDCGQYDLDTFKNIVHDDNQQLRMIHINIRSVNKNLDEFLLYLRKLDVKFPFICLGETWLASDDDFNDVPGYNAFHSTRGRPSGGVSILIDNQYQSKILPEFTTNTALLESVGVNIIIRGKPLNLICIYRPPSTSITEFNEEFSVFVKNIPKNELSYIVGDFNINMLDSNPSNAIITFSELMQTEFFFPLINVPTRVTDTSSTSIDLIYTNSLQKIISGTLKCNISDHHAIFSSIPLKDADISDTIKIEFRDHSPENINSLRNELYNELLSFKSYEKFPINDKILILNSILEKIYFKCCPIKSKIISRKKLCCPWITDSLLNSIAHKHWLEKQSSINPNMRDYYNRYKNTLRDIIDSAKKSYFEHKFRPSATLKQSWKVINSLIKPRKNKNSIELMHEGSLISDSSKVSDLLNEHFSTIAHELASKIPPTNTDPMSFIEYHHRTFGFHNCETDEIISIINKLKNKKSPVKDIPVHVYKSTSDIISPVLKDLINESVLKGIFPNILKIAKVVPLYKCGSKKQIKNYRPISILPILSKIFEKVMCSRILSFFEKFNLFSPNQFGFRSKKSTTDAILQFIDNGYNAMNDGKVLLSIYLDFSKAFDTIDHTLLCRKLDRYGIRGNINRWFKSYLSSRVQYVAVNDSKSLSKELSCGVPQGSILGPVLFLIYINDMQKSTNLNLIHYADDSTALATDRNLTSLCSLVNSELDKIDDWTRANKLSLNVEKTYFSIFTTRTANDVPDIMIRDKIITRSNTQKFLGVLIDEKLTFKKHIDKVCKKVSSGIGIIRKLKGFIGSEILQKIYNAIIYPHIIYAIEAWGASAKVGLTRLDNLITKASRLIGSNNDNAILNLRKVHERFCLIRHFKYCIKKGSTYFSNKFENQIPTHVIPTRFNSNKRYTTPRFKSAKYGSSFFFRTIKYCNKLPNDIRNINSLVKFKQTLKNKS